MIMSGAAKKVDALGWLRVYATTLGDVSTLPHLLTLVVRRESGLSTYAQNAD